MTVSTVTRYGMVGGINLGCSHVGGESQNLISHFSITPCDTSYKLQR